MAINRASFLFYDLRNRIRSSNIDLLFPDWDASGESIVIFSPHDDDAILGAGYCILAARASGASVNVVIFCDGSGGYSRIEDKLHIVAMRKKETAAAYAALGMAKENIHRFDLPDFSVENFLGWKHPDGSAGVFAKTIPLLRKLKTTRLVIANPYREHFDHTAVAKAGLWDGPQAGDPVVVDWGNPSKIRTFAMYEVWGSFSPEDALLHCESDTNVRGNRVIAAGAEVEDRIIAGIKEFASQDAIIDYIMNVRKRRQKNGRFLEPYLVFEPRVEPDFDAYIKRIREIDERSK